MHSPQAIGPSISSVPTAPATVVAALDDDGQRRRLLAGAFREGVGIPTRLAAVEKYPRPRGAARCRRFLAFRRHRDQERVAGLLQVAKDIDGPEAAIHQQIPRRKPIGTRLSQQAPDYGSPILVGVVGGLRRQ